jgi:Spy/CpxP family protein refolding chaperone
MRRTLTLIAAVITLVLSGSTRSVAQAPAPTGAQAAKPSVDDVLKALRSDLQASRADILSKNMTLTAEQAAKFWPMFEQYQKQQNVIMDEQLQGIQRYVDSYEKLDDAGALALMKAHLERDTRMTTLRQQFLNEFQTILPAKLAARAIQIDRRLGLVTQIEITSRIPLVR